MFTRWQSFRAVPRIYSRGAIVLAAADALELMGFMVDLRLFEMSFVDKDVHFSEFRLKQPDERVSLQKLYFPLCHPAWVRRLIFRLGAAIGMVGLCVGLLFISAAPNQ